MPRDKSINYVELPASDFAAVEAFYSSVFGWTFSSYGPEYHAFNDGVFNGGFFKSDLRSRQDQGAALIVLFAKNLEDTRDRVTAQQGEICKGIFSFPGGRRFHFFDPHGNELAVWSDAS
ncbi:MAG: VOC family protein [Planctomycetota bacterium]